MRRDWLRLALSRALSIGVVLVVSSGVLSLAACSSSEAGPGSDTNWLNTCNADDDCEQSLCRCGVCTLPCSGAGQCGGLPGAAVCIETSALSETSCRLGFAESPAGGLCAPACRTQADCEQGDSSATRCVQSLCLPDQAMTPQGMLGELPVDQMGEVLISLPVRPAADAGSAADSNTESVDAGPQVEDADVGPNGPVQVPSLNQLAAELPIPRPSCPCTTDQPSDAVPPRPGEAAPNAYGRPIVGASPDDQLFGGTSAFQCEIMHLPGFWFTLGGDQCVRYSSCDVRCERDADCPGGSSGDAIPRCAPTNACMLDCADGRGCPDGMVCVTGQERSACYWPYDVLDPECDGYCRQSPIPRDCPNWCAGKFTACDPERDVLCCEGLSCTEEGYCDEE